MPLLEEGRVEEGLSLVSEAWTLIDKNGQLYGNAELHRIEGELLLQQTSPDTSQAETCFRQALDSACRQQAKSLELRAATSLARLWHQQGKGDEARELLTPVYKWSTEGFGTADLQEATELLTELGP